MKPFGGARFGMELRLAPAPEWADISAIMALFAPHVDRAIAQHLADAPVAR